MFECTNLREDVSMSLSDKKSDLVDLYTITTTSLEKEKSEVLRLIFLLMTLRLDLNVICTRLSLKVNDRQKSKSVNDCDHEISVITFEYSKSLYVDENSDSR